MKSYLQGFFILKAFAESLKDSDFIFDKAKSDADVMISLLCCTISGESTKKSKSAQIPSSSSKKKSSTIYR